jgi:antagonist of KipI
MFHFRRHFLQRSRYFSSTTPDILTDAWFRPVGEGALLIRFGTEICVETNTKVLDCMHILDTTSNSLFGVQQILPAYASLLIHYDPTLLGSTEVEQWCRKEASDQDNASNLEQLKKKPPRCISIPVQYGGEYGPDLNEAATIANLNSPKDVCDIHSSGNYRVYFLGFTGGFPYMGGLPKELTSVPRLSTPRLSVPKGAVGIAAGQTGVYTLSSPGGWYLIGKTFMNLFNPYNDPPSLLQPGDEIKFVPTVIEELDQQHEVVVDENKDLIETMKSPCIKIISSGPMTTVQDIGRSGYGRYGVSRSGAADNLAIRMGNALLGNQESSACLEVAMGGLVLQCLERPIHLALTGANCNATIQRSMLLGAPPEMVRINETFTLRPGDELALGYAKDGARTYLCIQNGFDVPYVLGSRSTDIRAKLGGVNGRILIPGDILGCVQDNSTNEDSMFVPLRSVYDPMLGRRHERGEINWKLRVLAGPGNPEKDQASFKIPERHSALDTLVNNSHRFQVTPRSDRMAVCISIMDEKDNEGSLKKSKLLVGGQQMSEACVSGTIQLPPDGNPVILLAEHQTTGGYSVPCIVIQADLWQVGQMRPGDTLQFEETTEEKAREALLLCRAQSIETEVRISSGANIDMHRLSGGVNQLGNQHTYGHHETEYDLALSEFSDPYPPSTVTATSDPLWLPTLLPRDKNKSEWKIDLNADCGEGFDDEGLLKYVSSVNIACGGHVGTPTSIAKTVALAAKVNATIGAHPSFYDQDGFGRNALNTPPLKLRDQILFQVGALDALCRGVDRRVQYIKPHGALYHAVMAGGKQGEAVFEASQMLELPLLLMPQSKWATYGEGFAERAYDGDLLRPRNQPGAVIHDPIEAAKQGVSLASNMKLHTICVHGDSPNAVSVAKAVRNGLENAGYEICSFV